MFPGQGSQVLKMGLEVYTKYSVAKEVFHQVDDALNYKLSDIIFGDDNEKLLQTQNIDKVIGNSNFLALGDILFAYQTIDKEAKQQNKSFQNHLTHLLVHGILHLLGCDHETAEMAKIMEEQEIAILNKFKIPNPYL